MPRQTGTDAASHAYQICQLTNGRSGQAHQLHRLSNCRTDLPAEVCIKEATCQSSVSHKEIVTCSLQLRSPEGGATYAAVLVGRVAPSQPRGPLKPTAMRLDLSEPAVSSETANRRMSSDMSGPLSGMPVGTTRNAQVTNTCLPAGERPNKTPIFI
jgi:hypothetical protein